MKNRVKVLRLAALVWGMLDGCTPDKKPAQTAGPSAASAEAARLTGTQWNLEDLGGKPVITDSRATLTFPEPGRVAGKVKEGKLYLYVSGAEKPLVYRAAAPDSK